MTFTQLEYLIAIDTYRSFGAAAEKCFVTQPTLSMQIMKLEDSLGVKLFVRNKKPVVPTAIGKELIVQARITLAEFQKFKNIVKNQNESLSGELKIGIIPTVASSLIPRIITRFMTIYPDIKLQIWEENTKSIVQNITTGKIDCGIVSLPLNEPDLLETPLFIEKYFAYVSDFSELAAKKTVVPDDLNPDELWILNEGHCMRDQVLDICNNRKKSKTFQHYEYNTGSIETLKKMVDENNGITVLPELALVDLNPRQLEKIRHFESPQPSRQIGMLTQKSVVKRNMIEALINEIIFILPPSINTIYWGSKNSEQ